MRLREPYLSFPPGPPEPRAVLEEPDELDCGVFEERPEVACREDAQDGADGGVTMGR